MDDSYPVKLYIYDLSFGFAAIASPNLLKKKIDGIWHTSIVVYGKEHYFGSEGVTSCTPGTTVLGAPVKTEDLGQTQIPPHIFYDYLQGLGESTYAASTYNLLKHNCNNFSNELSQFLVGVNIPKYILDLPSEVLDTALGQQLLLGQSPGISIPVCPRGSSPEFDQLNKDIDETRKALADLQEKRNVLKEKLARKERKNKKKKKLDKEIKLEKSGCSHSSERHCTEVNMADGAVNGGNRVSEDMEKLPSQVAEEMEAQERLEREERKKNREPPIVYKDIIDVRREFDDLVSIIDSKLTTDEMQCLEELHQYMLEDEGSWALGEGFLNFIGKLLNDTTIPSEARVHLLNVIGAAALKDDVILLLHQDRRDHVLMNYAHDFDRLPVQEQESLALVICNLFENLSSSEWLLYISEWPYNNSMISNIRATTKVAVNSLLSDVETLQDRGSAIIHNLACKEVKTVVFDDIAVELTMALLQFFNGNPKEENLFRCMKALARFCQISQQDVPQLIQMIGPEPSKFNGTSPRVDEQISLVQKKLRT